MPVREKWEGLAAMREVLCEDGRLWVGDYGWQRTVLMRPCFRMIVQQLDDREDALYYIVATKACRVNKSPVLPKIRLCGNVEQYYLHMT